MTTAPALNPAQAEACAIVDGQLMVLAGPGTGKTRVITHRYRNLLRLPGVDTGNILVLTFTEKAAREMEERIATLCDTGFAEMWVSTFHAFALRFLQAEGHRLPIPRPFRIAPEVEKWRTMCAVLERTRPDELYRLPRPRDIVPELLKLLGRAKQEMAGPDDYHRIATEMVHGHRLGAELQVQVAAVYGAYQEELMRQGMLDFDDTIYWSVRLLEADEGVLARWRERLTHIMVDEFQDTDFSQLRMVEMLAGPEGRVAVVGDDDQSIYKFRGASVANLRRFRKVYPGLSIVRLDTNYRSTRQVLAPSGRLILQNPERIAKAVTSDRDGPRVRYYAAPDRDHEVAWTVERIAELIEGAGAEPVPAGEIAVLVRTNAQLRPFTRALQRAGIPYQLTGGRGFLDQPEIKDLRALLQVTADRADARAAARVLAMPGVGLRAETIMAIASAARRDEVHVEVAAGTATLDDDERARLERVVALLAELRATSLRERADEVVFQALERTRYVDLLEFPSEIQRRQAGANIEKFDQLVRDFCENDRGDGSLARLVEYLDAVEASQSEEAIATIDDTEDAVHLMTVHKSKGLEFTAVFCPGMVEDRFPMRPIGDALPLPAELIVEEIPGRDPRMSEERRLAYVALTRARRHLFLSTAERYEGGKKWKPSRFLPEMGFLPATDGRVVEAPAPEPVPVVEAAPDAPVPQPALPLGHPDVPELTVSYSQLAEYQNCPRAYQYRHLYHLPTRPSPEQDFGVIVHDVLRQVLEENRAAQPPLAHALAIFDQRFARDRFSDPVNADLWQERGRQFITALHRRGRLNGAVLHVAPEQPFNLSLPGFRVRGRIDRIDRDGERYRVIDYKTGDPKAEWELERDLQLGIYAIATERVLGLKPVTLAICYLDDANEVEVLKTTSQLEADRALAEDLAHGIIAADFTPAPTPWKCKKCDYKLVCDAAM